MSVVHVPSFPLLPLLSSVQNTVSTCFTENISLGVSDLCASVRQNHIDFVIAFNEIVLYRHNLVLLFIYI